MSEDTSTEQNQSLTLSTENDANTESVLAETAELANAVGDLTRDAYIGAVRQAQSFVKFLHKKIKS